LAAETYLGGSFALVAVVAVLAWGAWRLRAALLPEWSGPPARLAELTIALTTPVLLAQVLGSVGQFRPSPMLGACLAGGLVMGLGGIRVAARRAPGTATSTSLPRSLRFELIGAVVATAAVAAHWATHVGEAYARGMTHPDTLWYHAPFAARFVQTGWLTHLNSNGLEDLATPLHGYLPLTGSLFHSFVMLPFDSDVLSPLVSVAFAALGLLAAWTIGRRLGVGALLVLAAVMLLGVPTMIGTQPGQASSDIATAALLLVAFALLREGWLQPVPTALAGLAAGLAIATKLTVATPILVFTIGIVVLALRARRPSTAAWWCATIFVAGGYWIVRNWIVVGNPLPWSTFGLGPLQFNAVLENEPSLAAALPHWSTWDRYILPGMESAYGPVWPLVFVPGIAGLVIGVWRGRALERIAGIAGIAGIVAFAFIPWLGTFGGAGFVLAVRYLAPELLLGYALLAVQLARAPIAWRKAAVGALGMAIVVALVAPRVEVRELPTWPDGQWLLAVVVGLIVLGLGALALSTAGRTRVRALGVAAVALAVTAGVGGWFVQRDFHRDRYVDAGLSIDEINAYFRDRDGLRVGSVGTEQLYPFFGADLSNRVSKVRVAPRGSPTEQCRAWRRALTEGDYQYFVVADELFVDQGPEPSWITADSAASLVVVDGDAVLYRIDGPLDPERCE